MTYQIVAKNYGKSDVRISYVRRDGTRHDFVELNVRVTLDGDFEEAYLNADNQNVLATDTMKNTVYALARRHGIDCPEEFACQLADHFLDVPAVTYSEVEIVQKPWRRLATREATGDEAGHPHVFEAGSSERYRFTVGEALQDDHPLLVGSIEGMELLKTTGSGFSDFYRDDFTTLDDTDDRILCSTLSMDWVFRQMEQFAWEETHQQIRSSVVDVFANRYSRSVQQTLYEMGTAALDACDAIEQISLRMPNQHHHLVDLSPFGLDNPNVVFQPTDEPYGLISATVAR